MTQRTVSSLSPTKLKTSRLLLTKIEPKTALKSSPEAIKQRKDFSARSSISAKNSFAAATGSEQRMTLTPPLSPQQVIKKYKNYLSSADLKDINNYQKIYFLSRGEEQISTVENGVNFYKFHQGYHINFRYETLKFLGRGSFGTVVKCFDHKTQKNVAIKIIFDEPHDRKQTEVEISFLKTLSKQENGSANHHIVNIYDTFTFRNFICIVTDLCEADLYSYLKSKGFLPLSAAEVRSIGKQIADALAFIHSAKIAHSDLKPENIMFTDSSNTNISIIDFGCACYDRTPLYKVVQSLYYRSPEVIFNFKYGCEIDVWSFACILFEMVTGHPLFRAKDENQLIEQITALLGEPPLEMIQRSKKMHKFFDAVPANRAACDARKKRILSDLLSNKDPNLIDLISDCLGWLPAKRPTMKQILEHPFFKQ